MHEKTLIVRIVARNVADDSAILRLIPLDVAYVRSLEHNPHVPPAYGTPPAVTDLEVHCIGVQGVTQNEVLHDGQRGRVNPPGQFLVIRIFCIDLDRGNLGVPGDIRDGDSKRL